MSQEDFGILVHAFILSRLDTVTVSVFTGLLQSSLALRKWIMTLRLSHLYTGFQSDTYTYTHMQSAMTL